MSTSRWAKVPNRIALLMFLGGFFIVLWSAIWGNMTRIGWGFFILGGGILGMVILTQYARYQFIKRAFHADGIVVAHKEKRSDDGRVWFPIVSYVLPDGQEITFQSRNFGYGFRKSLPVSTKVDVLYDPENPTNAMINRFLEKFGVSIIGIPFAIILMAFGILVIVGLIHLQMM